MDMDKRFLIGRIESVFEKWERAIEEGRRDNQPLNDNVIAAIRKDIDDVLATDL